MGVETALLITAMVGVGVTAYSQYKEGQDAAEAAKYNAKVSRRNAELEAVAIEQSGAVEASQKRKEIKRLISTQKAKYGAAGIELTGSPLEVMIGTAAEGELDAQIIEYNAKREAYATRYGAASQGIQYERAAEAYQTSGTLKAASTILTSASKIRKEY